MAEREGQTRGGVAACCRPIGLCPRAAAWPEGGGARRRMRPHTDAGFGALSGERGAYLPAERPSAASSAARLAATQQQRCRASTAPASQRRPRHPPSRARQGATVDARRLKAPRASHCSFFPPTHPACAGEFLGCAAASMSSATHAQRRLSTSNGGPSRPGEASPAGSSCTRAPTAATAARASTAAAAAAAAAAATARPLAGSIGGSGFPPRGRPSPPRTEVGFGAFERPHPLAG